MCSQRDTVDIRRVLAEREVFARSDGEFRAGGEESLENISHVSAALESSSGLGTRSISMRDTMEEEIGQFLPRDVSGVFACSHPSGLVRHYRT